MYGRFIVAAFCISAVAVLAAQPAGNPNAAWKAPRLADGTPDIQGIYNFSTITPLQRPTGLEGKATLNDQEASEFEASENKRQNRDLYDPEKGQPSAGYAPRSQGGVLSYNEFWYERGNKLTEDRRTSLITDPPDGRVPFTAETRAKNADRGQKLNTGFADSYTDRSLADRCILGFNSGPPMISGAYNNNMQIVQTPGLVVIVNEMVHNTRIIPTDGRPHGTLRQWAGDSRGHWEGETLVVDTINFLRETSAPGSSASTHLVERFTRIDPDTVKYEFTMTDPSTLTAPWSAMMPLNRSEEVLFEYACHEGNYAMAGILGGARAKERAAKQGKK